MKIKDFKILGDIEYSNFPLIEYVYNEIVIEDCYGLKQLKENQVKTIIDIGGNLGVFSIYARELFPNIRIISLEAIYDTYKSLKQNTLDYNIETYNIALGDGSILYFNYCKDHSGANQLKKDKKHANTNNVSIRSKTLKDIFDTLKIEGPYLIKMDIEGSELFLYEDQSCIDILRECEYFTMEFHKLQESKIDKLLWDQWLMTVFNNHNINGLGGNAPGAVYKINKMNNKDLYNEIYTKNKAYNHNVMYKYTELSKFANNIKQNVSNPKILDAGCGEGWNLTKLTQEGFDVFGIEISDICCNKFLQNLPHKCTDIISYYQENIKYDALICFDVLEHISYSEIDNTIKALSIMAPKALLGVANHSDIQYGHELHLIQQEVPYWENKFQIFYKDVKFIANLGGNFYLFECSNVSI